MAPRSALSDFRNAVPRASHNRDLVSSPVVSGGLIAVPFCGKAIDNGRPVRFRIVHSIVAGRSRRNLAIRMIGSGTWIRCREAGTLEFARLQSGARVRLSYPAQLRIRLRPLDCMNLIDYNGDGRWSREAILSRYARYATELGIEARDLTPLEHTERGRHWVYPVMERVIAGIEAGDPACIRIGIEFIEEDKGFPFGRVLKSNTARALRRARLTNDQCSRIRRRVVGMLRAGYVPREFQDYAKLVKKIGIDASDLLDVPGTNERVVRFWSYLKAAARGSAD